ncbi:MAG: hypothetical protein ACREL1_01610 [bacterium]
MSKNNLELAGLFRLKIAQDPGTLADFFVGGGVALQNFSGKETLTESGTSTTHSLSTATLISPLVEAGVITRLPIQDNLDFFVEGRAVLIFQGEVDQTLTESGVPFPVTTPSTAWVEIPIQIGLCFSR